MLSNKPYNGKWIWTCGENGEWNCKEGVVNKFEIDLCQLSVADNPNHLYNYITRNTIYLILLIVSGIMNIALLKVFCCKSPNKYTKIKRVNFNGNDGEQICKV
eukprot:425520_1